MEISFSVILLLSLSLLIVSTLSKSKSDEVMRE
jgi:hypothetical protein